MRAGREVEGDWCDAISRYRGRGDRAPTDRRRGAVSAPDEQHGEPAIGLGRGALAPPWTVAARGEG